MAGDETVRRRPKGHWITCRHRLPIGLASARPTQYPYCGSRGDRTPMRPSCPLLVVAAIAAQHQHVAMGQIRTDGSGNIMHRTIVAISHVWTAPCWQGLFWCCHEELVGSAHVSGLFARREHRWPSCYPQDRLPIKSTRSRRSGMNGFCRSPVVDRLLHDLTCRPFQLHEARPDGHADCYAACVTGSRYSPPRVISTQAIRAILLAMATAAILLFRRCNSLSNQGRRVPWR
jgi:hypothetical protein